MSEMTMEWWYALVRAAPQPETGESVNVGILVGNGKPQRLVFQQDLPRLTPLCRPADRRVFSELLEQLSIEVGQADGLPYLRAAIGPQIKIDDARRLHYEPDEDTVSALRRRYLEAARGSTDREKELKILHRGRRRLDEEINRSTRIGMEFYSRPNPHLLYSKAGEWGAGIRIPTLGRAVRGTRSRRDLLLDAIVLDPDRRRIVIEVATSRINRAFWYYKRLAREIKKFESREVRTVGVMILPHGQLSRDLRDTRDFIYEEWSRNAGKVHITTGSERVLREEIAWAVGDQ